MAPSPTPDSPSRDDDGSGDGGAQLSVKQEREQRRLTKVAAFKKQQARAHRARVIAISISSLAAVAVVALLVTIIVTSATPQRERADIDIEGLKTWADIDYTHTDDPVDYAATYGMTPPAGGSHSGRGWINCGIYSEPQPNELATHDLEHGAVWVTYDAARVAGADLEALIAKLPKSYILLSPYEGLDAPVVASAWGAQIKLDGVDDPRLGDFVEKYWQSGDVPEPGARCDGAFEGPGKVA